jgi:hypothetical protein
MLLLLESQCSPFCNTESWLLLITLYLRIAALLWPCPFVLPAPLEVLHLTDPCATGGGLDVEEKAFPFLVNSGVQHTDH